MLFQARRGNEAEVRRLSEQNEREPSSAERPAQENAVGFDLSGGKCVFNRL